jgi:hypothetical protein
MNVQQLPSSKEGSLVWMTAGRVRVSVVHAVFTALGLAKALPKREKRAIALRIAAGEYLKARFGKRKLKLLPLDRRVLGFEVREKFDGQEMNDLPYVLTIKADARGAWITYAGTLAPQNESDEVSRRYLDRMHWYCPTTVGAICKRAIENHLGGTSVRGNGGLWFVPGRSFDDLRRIAEGLEVGPNNPDSEHRMTAATFDVSANPGVARDAVESLRHEIRAACDEINADLLGAHEMTGPGRQGRQDRLATMRAKVEEYSALFGETLDDLAKTVEATDAALALSALEAVEA